MTPEGELNQALHGNDSVPPSRSKSIMSALVKDKSAESHEQAVHGLGPSEASSIQRRSRSSSPDALVVEGADDLLAELTDPPNRFYRYRVARAMLPLFVRTPLTPNHITALHAMTGIVAGLFIARGTSFDFIVAFVLAELRMILDCLDGVLARAKNIRSPMGRTIDEFGDTVGYIGMQVGAYVYIYRHQHSIATLSWVLVGSILGPAYMAVVYDFYKRKFTSALKENQDAIVQDAVRKKVQHAGKPHGVLYRFSQMFDGWQILVLAPGSRPVIDARVRRELGGGQGEVSAAERRSEEEVRAIRAFAHSRRFRYTLRFLSWVTGDNGITVFNVGILTGAVMATEKAVIFSGFLMTFLGAAVGRWFVNTAMKKLAAEGT